LCRLQTGFTLDLPRIAPPRFVAQIHWRSLLKHSQTRHRAKRHHPSFKAAETALRCVDLSFRGSGSERDSGVAGGLGHYSGVLVAPICFSSERLDPRWGLDVL